jgi:ribulose-phosphate 3-epimerase
MIQIIPAIIPSNLEEIKDKIARVTGLVDTVQIDVADGSFAPTTTWPYLKKEIAKLPHGITLEYEIDLLLKNPEEHITEWALAGAKSVVAYIESTERYDEVIELARKNNIKIGMGTLPSTPIEALGPHINQVNFIQVMGNDKIGYHGVSLDPAALIKIKELRKKYPELTIGIDIGVNLKTAPSIVEAGANRLVAGSAVFNSNDIKDVINKFKSI